MRSFFEVTFGLYFTMLPIAFPCAFKRKYIPDPQLKVFMSCSRGSFVTERARAQAEPRGGGPARTVPLGTTALAGFAVWGIPSSHWEGWSGSAAGGGVLSSLLRLHGPRARAPAHKMESSGVCMKVARWGRSILSAANFVIDFPLPLGLSAETLRLSLNVEIYSSLDDCSCHRCTRSPREVVL